MLNLTRSQIDQIFAAENLSATGRIILNQLIERYPTDSRSEVDNFIAEVRRFLAKNEPIAAIKFARAEAAKNTAVFDYIRTVMLAAKVSYTRADGLGECKWFVEFLRDQEKR